MKKFWRIFTFILGLPFFLMGFIFKFVFHSIKAGWFFFSDLWNEYVAEKDE